MTDNHSAYAIVFGILNLRWMFKMMNKSCLAEPVPKEVTVVLVKPDAVKEGKVEEIIQKVWEAWL